MNILRQRKDDSFFIEALKLVMNRHSIEQGRLSDGAVHQTVIFLNRCTNGLKNHRTMDQPRTQGSFKGKIPRYDVELRICDLTCN